MKKVIQMQANLFAPVHHEGTMLNEQQLAAIQDLQGYHVINAGPGCGKSKTLVARTCKLREVYPSASVLMLAFSKSAAQELRERVGDISGVTISTLHNLAYYVLKSSAGRSRSTQAPKIKRRLSNRLSATARRQRWRKS